MPEEVYPRVTIGGKDYYRTDTLIPVEYDPTNGVMLFVGAPTGGLMVAGPLVKGDRGKHTEFQVGPQDFTPLAWNDPTPASVEIVEVTPGSDDVSQVVRLAVAIHEGQPGEDGNTVLDPGDFTGAAPKKQIVLNSDASAFVLQTQKVGDLYYPTSYNSIASGNVNGVCCVVSIPAQDFDWRPHISGWCIVTPSGGTDVRVDLVARLNADSSGNGGNIIGRGAGLSGVTDRIPISGRLPASVGDSHNRIPAGQGPTTIHLRAERQQGSNTFTTSDSTTAFEVKVNPVP